MSRRKVARVASLQHGALWRKRAAETAMGLRIVDRPASDRARDKWAIRTLERSGALPTHLIEAANRYRALLEKTHVRRSGALGEHVSGGRSDPHSAMLNAIEAGRAAETAASAVRAKCRDRDAAIFDAAFAYPHPSIADLRGQFGVDYRGVVRALEATLTRLWAWFVTDDG